MEHMNPLSRGGEHSVHNVIPACRGCNLRKKDRGLAEFLLFINPDFGFGNVTEGDRYV